MQDTKTKRIKKVFSSADQVIHVWANQSQNEARCKNVFFTGRQIYSYGYHYELGRLVEYKGHTIALINNDGYSVTTAKQIGYAWTAVEHMPRFYVSGANLKFLDLDDPNKEDLRGVIEASLLERQDAIIEREFNRFNGRKFGMSSLDKDARDYDDELIAEYNKYCDMFGFKSLLIPDLSELRELQRDHAKLYIEKEKQNNTPEALAKKAAILEKREAKAKEKLHEDIQKWRDGGRLPQGARDLAFQLVRVNGFEVETSRGATVPLTHAVRLLKLIESGKVSEGERIGHFQLTSVVAKGKEAIITIGCHKILLSEARQALAKNMTSTLEAV